MNSNNSIKPMIDGKNIEEGEASKREIVFDNEDET